MKIRRTIGLLVTAACAASLLCLTAWAANARVEKVGGNVALDYDLQTADAEDSSKIGAEVKAQVKTTARRTSSSVVDIAMSSRAEAENQLGISYVSSSVFDALPKGGDEKLTVSFKPSQKIVQTHYAQYRADGAVQLTFSAVTRWDGSDDTTMEQTMTAKGASAVKTDHTAPDGRVYQVYSVKDAAGNVTTLYTVFQHGATTYTLQAWSDAAVPQNYLDPILDTLSYPA